MNIFQNFLRTTLTLVLLGALAACGDTSTQNESDHGHSHE